MDRVCLIIPPSPFLADERVFVSLGILKVAACLEQAGYPVDVLDLSGVENYGDIIRNYINNNSASMYFGITVTTAQCPAAETVTNRIREAVDGRRTRIIWGGPHITVVSAARKLEVKKGIVGRAHKAFARIANIADVLVAGDGEQAIFEALETNNKLVDADDPESRMFLNENNITSYPFPARHLVDIKGYRYNIDGVPATSIIAQLGCPYSCIAENTMLGSNEWLLKPSEIIFSETDICPDGHLHNLGHVGHSTIVSNGQKECINIRFANGLDLTVTKDHPILCVSNEKLTWKEAGNLDMGDYAAFEAGQNRVKEYVKLPPPSSPKKHSGFQWQEKKVMIPALLDERVAWLVGLLISDGSLPKDNRPSIHFAVKLRSEEKAKQYIQDCFGITGALSTHTLTTKMKNLWVHSRRVRNFFTESIGIDPEYKLTVPKVIRQSSKEIVKAFLNGLWAGDGYFPKDSPHAHSYLATVSEPFAKEVAQLAIWCGYGASVVRGSKSRLTNKYSWRVVLCLEECWSDKKGHPCLTSSIPINHKRIYRSRKSRKLFWRTSKDRKQKGVTRILLKEIAPYHELVQGSFIYVPVKEIREVGYRNVYDLSVPHIHRFTASGVAVHNCSFCSGRLSPSFRRVRTRNIKNVLLEIREIYRDYSFEGIQWYDDELNVNPNFTNDLKEIIKLRQELGVDFHFRGFLKANLFNENQAALMKEAGFRQVCIGFESGSPRILRNIKKAATVDDNTSCMEIAHKYGIKVKAFMSLAHPGESYKTIEETRNWLLDVAPDDFDCTIVTVLPGTPYYDFAVQLDGHKNVWTYAAASGDKMHAVDIDFAQDVSYYKGIIDGGYKSFVWTDYISAEDLVKMRDWLERDVRNKLGIPFYSVNPASRFEASMGQLPGYIYRRSDT